MSNTTTYTITPERWDGSPAFQIQTDGKVFTMKECSYFIIEEGTIATIHEAEAALHEDDNVEPLATCFFLDGVWRAYDQMGDYSRTGALPEIAAAKLFHFLGM